MARNVYVYQKSASIADCSLVNRLVYVRLVISLMTIGLSKALCDVFKDATRILFVISEFSFRFSCFQIVGAVFTSRGLHKCVFNFGHIDMFFFLFLLSYIAR